MTISKYLKYGLIAVGGIVACEVYALVTLHLRNKWNTDELNETIMTQCELDTRLACYDSKDEKCMRVMRIVKCLIDSSSKTIHLAMYIFTHEKLCEALIRAHKRGVKVFVVIDSSMEAASKTRIDELKENGVPVKIWTVSTFHHKFCLIDVPFCHEIFRSANKQPRNGDEFIRIPHNGVLATGSMNWTNEGLTKNHENIIVTSNKSLIQPYTKAFVDIWTAAS